MPQEVDRLDVFAYHAPMPEQIERIECVRRAYAICLEYIRQNVMDNRYRSVAITQLESSAMFAIKGLVLENEVPSRG